MKQKQKHHRQQLFVEGLPLFLGAAFFCGGLAILSKDPGLSYRNLGLCPETANNEGK